MIPVGHRCKLAASPQAAAPSPHKTTPALIPQTQAWGRADLDIPRTTWREKGQDSSCAYSSIGLPLPPALVAADPAVDLHHVALSQRQLPHVPRREVVACHRRPYDPRGEHCEGTEQNISSNPTEQPKPGESSVGFNLGFPSRHWLPLQCRDLDQLWSHLNWSDWGGQG